MTIIQQKKMSDNNYEKKKFSNIPILNKEEKKHLSWHKMGVHSLQVGPCMIGDSKQHCVLALSKLLNALQFFSWKRSRSLSLFFWFSQLLMLFFSFSFFLWMFLMLNTYGITKNISGCCLGLYDNDYPKS